MTRYIIISLLLSCCAHLATAQDDATAREHYLKAETAFLGSRWQEALAELKKAEQLLGKNTPKTQFLKVLAYEKLALADVSYLDAAVAEAQRYLQFNNLPPLHMKYRALVQEIANTLPTQARAAHEAREQQRRLQEKIAWQEAARKFRLGFGVAPSSARWLGTELTLLMGTRSGLWLIGASTQSGYYLSIEDEVHKKLLTKFKETNGATFYTSIVHLGYLQGIRVLPRERDFIKPLIGARVIYHGELGEIYKARNESGTDPSPAVLKELREYGLEPRHFFDQKTSFRSGVSFDVVVGAMAHLGSTTFYAGMDVINSKRAQFGVAFKISQ